MSDVRRTAESWFTDAATYARDGDADRASEAGLAGLAALRSSRGTMTQEEFAAMPIMDTPRAMFQTPSDGAVIDSEGQRWMIGTVDGVRYRQRIR